MMTCRDVTNDLLAEPLSASVRAHLERCEACRLRCADLRSLAAELAALGRALPPASSPALVRRIAARLPARRSAAGRWAAGFAAAAAILVAVVVATRQPPAAPAPEPREMVAIPAPPPIETVLDPVPPPPAPRPPEPVPPRIDAPAPVPAPVPVPAPTPAPAPVETPKPAPVEPPKPAPAPETRPARIVVAITAVEGPLELRSGIQWEKVAKAAAEWDAAAGLRSGDRAARFALPDGTRVVLRPRTELRLLAAAPPSLSLERGEAYFDVVPAADRRFSVVTADARVQVTGTQFSVKRNDHTEVYVTSGEVQVATEKGEVAVPAGSATSARKGAAPAKPRALDADRALAWRRELDAPETIRFRYDFEDGRLPFPWSTGRVVNFGPTRGVNRFCLQGGPGIDCDLSRVDKRVWAMKPGLTLRFRYWTRGAEAIWVQLSCPRVQDNFRYELKHISTGKWETFEIPVAEFYRLLDPDSHPQEGDRFLWFNIAVAGVKGDLYFDDIELVEVQK